MNWSATKRLTWTSGDSIYPAVAADGGSNIHVVWYDDTPGNAEVYYKGSGDGGDSWDPVKRLTWHERSSRSPVRCCEFSGRCLCGLGGSRITGLGRFITGVSTDEGATWSSPLRLTWTERYSNCSRRRRFGEYDPRCLV